MGRGKSPAWTIFGKGHTASLPAEVPVDSREHPLLLVLGQDAREWQNLALAACCDLSSSLKLCCRAIVWMFSGKSWHPYIARWHPPPESWHGSKPRGLSSVGFWDTAPFEIKFWREALPGWQTAWTQTGRSWGMDGSLRPRRGAWSNVCEGTKFPHNRLESPVKPFHL